MDPETQKAFQMVFAELNRVNRGIGALYSSLQLIEKRLGIQSGFKAAFTEDLQSAKSLDDLFKEDQKDA